MANVNTEYEKLTQEIYQTLNDAEGIQTTNIQHNIKVKGKSGCEHQIDVYWEFKNIGETHCVAIECKNFSDTVSIGRVRDFFGVIHDIGNIKGVFVSKYGFQAGAKQFAKYYGISLKEMRPPTDKDWEGRIRTLDLTISEVYATNIQRKFFLDMDWIKKAYPEFTRLKHSARNNETMIVDSAGNVINSMMDFDNQLINLNEQISEQVSVSKLFNLGDDAYIVLEETKYKLLGIEYTYDISIKHENLIFDGATIAKAILADIESGDRYFFDKYGNVNKSSKEN
ncbi:MAG: restriction endonuclease [Clostridiales bacterium]|nr:restriction endonuclease [Clostridiales bacterium]